MSKLVWLLFPFYLFSVSIDPEMIIKDTDVSLIHGLIDNISGGLIYSSSDFVIEGIEPICIQRCYGTLGNNLNKNDGWFLFPDAVIIKKK